MPTALTCPQCRKDGVLRSHCQSFVERLAEVLFVSPFRCQACQNRFWACRLGKRYPTHLVDRREHLRIPVRLFLSFSGGRIRGEGMVMDLSMGGCIIKSEAQIHVNDIFYLQISIEDGEPPLELAAMVRSISTRGIAFKFLRAAQDNRRLLTFVQSKATPQALRPAA
jgi:hypothetical protein